MHRFNRIVSDTAESWRPVYIEPGTRDLEEPEEVIPAGWYVTGANEPTEPSAVIRIEAAYNVDGYDTSGAIAAAIADALNAAVTGESKRTSHQPPA